MYNVTLTEYSLAFFSSYDTWVPAGDIEDEPQPEPQHQGPWQVTQCTLYLPHNEPTKSPKVMMSQKLNFRNYGIC